MNVRGSRWAGVVLVFATATSLLAQSKPPASAPPPAAGHDITAVDAAPLGGAIAIPLPPSQQNRLKKYEIPELAGARQALGPQLVDGRLPRPLLDFSVKQGPVEQRLSFFERGLVIVAMKGAGGTIQKKLILPPDAVAAYTRNLTRASLDAVSIGALSAPQFDRRASLRVYDQDGRFAERSFDPIVALPKNVNDWILPLQDLLRALSEDRTVTNTVAGYQPKAGDLLVGDDRKTWEVTRVIPEGDMVVLRCLTEPTTIYVAKKDLYNYFIGSRAAASSR